jgi:hypothetical protein
MSHRHEFDDWNLEEKLEPWFTSLRDEAVERTPVSFEKGRAAFVAEAAKWASTVSPTREKRRIGWTINIRKEPMKMSTLLAIVVVFTMLFGGAGATVYAAQDSDPSQPLYRVKLASEDVQFGLAFQNRTRIELSLQFANRRIEEIINLLASNENIPEALANRWEFHVQEAFRLAAQQAEAEFEPAMSRIQRQLQHQEQLLSQLHHSHQAEPVVVRIRSRLRIGLENIEAGLEDPLQYRLRLQQGNPFENMNGNLNQNEEAPGPNEDSGNGSDLNECEDCEPGDNQNRWKTGTPESESGTGQGPGDCVECDPSDPNYNGPRNPWTTGTPTPESGYGPGPGECEDCEPQGPIGPGPQRTPTSSSGSSGGSGSNNNPGRTEPSGGSNNGGGGNRP